MPSGGVDLLGQGLEELRDKLNAKFFLYESTGDLESLLVAVSSFVKVGRLLDDVDAGRRLSIKELKKTFPGTGRANSLRKGKPRCK